MSVLCLFLINIAVALAASKQLCVHNATAGNDCKNLTLDQCGSLPKQCRVVDGACTCALSLSNLLCHWKGFKCDAFSAETCPTDVCKVETPPNWVKEAAEDQGEEVSLDNYEYYVTRTGCVGYRRGFASLGLCTASTDECASMNGDVAESTESDAACQDAICCLPARWSEEEFLKPTSEDETQPEVAVLFPATLKADYGANYFIGERTTMGLFYQDAYADQQLTIELIETQSKKVHMTVQTDPLPHNYFQDVLAGLAGHGHFFPITFTGDLPYQGDYTWVVKDSANNVIENYVASEFRIVAPPCFASIEDQFSSRSRGRCVETKDLCKQLADDLDAQFAWFPAGGDAASHCMALGDKAPTYGCCVPSKGSQEIGFREMEEPSNAVTQFASALIVLVAAIVAF